jgi:hypothetical protein
MKTFPTEHASIFPDPIIPGFQNSSIPIEALLQRFWLWNNLLSS